MDDTLFSLMEAESWTYFIKCLQKYKDQNRHGFWTDGDLILCRTEEAAENVANFLEDIGFDTVMTGYYDPVEDERNGTVDDHTGFWYVDID